MKSNEELIKLLTGAINMRNQTLINTYACELAKRLYVPGRDITFEELMEGFGYKKIEKVDPNQITIEEYMKEVEKNECGRKRSKGN